MTITNLAEAKPTTVRAFIAMRRREGVGFSHLGHALTALTSFFRHPEMQGLATAVPIEAAELPKVERPLPKPLAVADAKALLEAPRMTGERPWVTARDVPCPVAVLRGRAAHFLGAGSHQG